MPEEPAGELYIYSDDIDTGKTGSLAALVKRLDAAGRRTAGVLSHKLMCEGSCTGYEAEFLAGGTRAQLALTKPAPGTFSWGRFHFFSAVFEQLAGELVIPAPDLFVLDEVGPLELSGGGFARWLPVVTRQAAITIIVIRKQCLEECIRHFELQRGIIIHKLEMFD